jgi:hypothetical protein
MKSPIKHLACLLMVMLACTSLPSCGDDEHGKIELSKGESSKVTVAANTSSGSINFTAAAPWSAYTSTQSRSSDSVDWIHLDTTGGSAGEVSLTFTLDSNTTGSNRTAYIIIVCDDETLTITITQTTETDALSTIAFTLGVESVTGFEASLKGNFSEVSDMLSDTEVYISDYPFTEQDISDGNDYTPYSIRLARSLSLDFDRCQISGLQPLHTYYVMQKNIGDDGKTYLSNLVKVETPDESWFSSVRPKRQTMKDAVISVYLATYLEPEWNNYTITYGYEIESKSKQMSASYRKVSPEFETWDDTDTPRSDNMLSNGTDFAIELHNLQPGETVSVTPWVTINGTRHDSETIEFTTYQIATSGYVWIGAGMYAACNVGASQPYEIGTLYNDPNDVAIDDENAGIPGYTYWEVLMSDNKQKVCGSLEDTDGWFIMWGENTIFLPFNKTDEDGVHTGNYWGSDSFHPSDWGAGAMAQLFFSCNDNPWLIRNMDYGTYQYTIVGKYDMMVRLAKRE